MNRKLKEKISRLSKTKRIKLAIDRIKYSVHDDLWSIPESKLAFAIIRQAIIDLSKFNQRKDSIIFFSMRDIVPAELLDIDSDFVRRVLVEHDLANKNELRVRK